MENQLFIIPIYLRSPSQYDDERKFIENKEIDKNGEVQFGKKYELNWPPWQYNDVIGYFEICINSHKVISVEKYFTEYKHIPRYPRKSRPITYILDFSLSPSYDKLCQYFNNQEMELKQRLANILSELNEIVNRSKYFIDISYYNYLLEYLDIEGFIIANDDN